MATTLTALSNLTLGSLALSRTWFQGLATKTITDAVDIVNDSGLTIGGQFYDTEGNITTATVKTIYDSTVNFPATFQIGFFWCDQKMYIQLIGSASNSQHPVVKYIPFWIPGIGSVLAAANQVLITGGSEPAVTAITKIVVGNYSGSTANYVLGLIN